MTFDPYRPPLAFRIRPSPVLAAGMVSVHVLATIGLTTSDCPADVAVPLGAAIAAHLAWAAAHHAARRSPGSVVELVWTGGQSFLLEHRDGRTREARLCPGAFVHPWLAVVTLAGAGMRRPVVVLTADAVGSDEFRCLRVVLRVLAGAPGGEDAG